MPAPPPADDAQNALRRDPQIVQPDTLRWSGAARARTAAGPVDVFGVEPGERVRVVVGDRGRARLMEIVEPSPHRVDPRCPQMVACPGCPLRAIEHPRRRHLTDALHRRALGSLGEGVPWRRLPGAADDEGRARAVARALRDVDGRLILGMVRRDHPPITLGACPLQNAGSRTLIGQLQRELRAAGVEPWDAERRCGTLRHVVVHAIGSASRVILAVDGKGPALPLERLLPDRPEVSLLVDALPRRGAGLLNRPRLVRGQPWLHFAIDGDRFRAGPRAWVPQAPQTIPAVREAVVDAMASMPADRLIEIGCGVGILSLPLARRCASLVGVDIEREAIVDARANAAANGVDNASFRTGDAAHALRRLLAGRAAADGVVMHAMRRPFGPQAMACVRALAPRRIVCLSPFAPALARDLELLPGYRVEGVALCDQTPGTVPDLTLITLARR